MTPCLSNQVGSQEKAGSHLRRGREVIPILVSPWHFNVTLKIPFFCFIWEKSLKNPFCPHTAQFHTHPSPAKPLPTPQISRALAKAAGERLVGHGLKPCTSRQDITHFPSQQAGKQLPGSQVAFSSLKSIKENKRQKSMRGTPRSNRAHENSSSWACKPAQHC